MNTKFVTNLKNSIKLHELGITLHSIFFTDSTKSKEDDIERWGNNQSLYCHDNINRYLADELGELLPSYLLIEGEIWLMRIIKNPDEWGIYYENDKHAGYIGTEGGGCIFNESLANAIAEMVYYLVTNNLIKI